MTPEEEKIVAHNMRVYIESVFNANKHNGFYFLSPTPSYSEDAISIVKMAMSFGKECFEIARNTSYETRDYNFETFEDYIKSFSKIKP